MTEASNSKDSSGLPVLRINDRVMVWPDELSEHFVRASGAGGQNVNKVSTAVQLRFDVANARSLPIEVRQRLKSIAGRTH